jgi:ABC-type amino acid transport substrate-binding protein
VEKGVITCAYIPYFHYFTVDEAGRPTGGEFYDLIHKVAERYNLQVAFVEQVGYGSVAWRLNAGFVDVFACPMRPTIERRLHMFFSETIFSSPVYAYLRQDSPYAARSIDDLSTDATLRIAIKENDVHHELAAQQFPLATLVRVPQLSHIHEVMEYVYDQKADMTFRDPELVRLYSTECNRDQTIFIQK